MRGYIKLHRKLLDNEWHDDPITMAVWVYCLLRANFEPVRWRGEIIQPGQFVTSLKNMAKDVGISVRQLRTALNHLKSTRQVTCQATQSATLVTIENWAVYQSAGERATQQATRQATNDRQTTDKRPTTNKEYIEYKNTKESERDIRERADSQLLSDQHEQFADIKAMLAAGSMTTEVQ